MINKTDIPPDPNVILSKIDDELARVGRGSDENRASRLFIMRYVVVIYATVLATSVASIFLEAYMSGNWDGTAGSMLNIASVMVLPVLTLVLGYYFGREGRTGT